IQDTHRWSLLLRVLATALNTRPPSAKFSQNLLSMERARSISVPLVWIDLMRELRLFVVLPPKESRLLVIRWCVVSGRIGEEIIKPTEKKAGERSGDKRIQRTDKKAERKAWRIVAGIERR